MAKITAGRGQAPSLQKRRLKTETVTVNFGPQHPSTHGVLYLEIELDGEIMQRVEPHIGYAHRGLEKLAENRTYSQFIAIMDRADYLSALNNELAYVLAVEKLLQVEVPERAEYLRVIMAELTRIASHLLFYGAYGLDLGAITPFLYGWREREKTMDLFEMAAGYRLHPNYFRFGGVREDVSEEFLEQTAKFCEGLPAFVDEYDRLLTGNEIFLLRTKGTGKFTPKQAFDLGVTGPLLRGTGFKWDLRKNEPYSVYGQFDFEIPTGKQGDAFDAYKVRMEEMKEASRIIKQALDKLPEGKIRTKLPYLIKPPAGEVYARIESPRGELGVYVVSDGSEKPYRLKIRGPSFMNLMLLPVLLKGAIIADAIAIIGMTDPVMGEVDR